MTSFSIIMLTLASLVSSVVARRTWNFVRVVSRESMDATLGVHELRARVATLEAPVALDGLSDGVLQRVVLAAADELQRRGYHVNVGVGARRPTS